MTAPLTSPGIQPASELDVIFNSIPSSLIGITDNGTIIHVNDSAQHILVCLSGLENKIVRLQENIFDHPIDKLLQRSIIDEVARNQSTYKRENLQIKLGNRLQYSDITVSPVQWKEGRGVLIRIDDVSNRVRVESMLIQNEKMIALGELAAWLAHEINNPVCAILNSIHNIHRRLAGDRDANLKLADELGLDINKVQEYFERREIFQSLNNISAAGERAGNIVENMLNFSRNNGSHQALYDLPKAIDQALEFARNAFETATPEGLESLKIVKEYETGLPQILCSQEEIQQVVINLIRNAFQAFPNQSLTNRDPTITIRIFSEDGQWACIEIEDNGSGIDEAIMDHIFEPFYTTKDIGYGTGLGLSVSYFIITDRHKGSISVKSRQNAGSCFTIKLPINTVR